MSGKIKVEIVTERKIMRVAIARSMDWIEVNVCVKCSAVVFDPIQHDKWHRRADHTDGSE